MVDRLIERLVDLVDPAVNRIHNMSVEEARSRVARGSPDGVREIDGSFALVGREGEAVRLARSLDRPLRYFLAKRGEGPALVASDWIDAIHEFLESAGLGGQFHPSYTRMVPAHHVVEVRDLEALFRGRELHGGRAPPLSREHSCWRRTLVLPLRGPSGLRSRLRGVVPGRACRRPRGPDFATERSTAAQDRSSRRASRRRGPARRRPPQLAPRPR